MTRKFGLKGICLVVLLIGGALPALAQQDRYDERDESVSPEALAQFRKGERLAKNENFDEAIAAFTKASELSQGTPIKQYADKQVEGLKARKGQSATPAKP